MPGKLGEDYAKRFCANKGFGRVMLEQGGRNCSEHGVDKGGKEEAPNSEEDMDSKQVVEGLLIGMGKQTLGSVCGRGLVTYLDYFQVASS